MSIHTNLQIFFLLLHLLSNYYVPAALGAALIAAAAMRGVRDAAEFFPLLLTGTVGYVAGFLALQYEIESYWRQRTLDYYRKNPEETEPWKIILGDDAMTVSAAHSGASYRYTTMTNATIFEDLIVAQVGSTPRLLVPLSAFADRAAAATFLAELRARIKAAQPPPTPAGTPSPPSATPPA